MKIIDTHVHIFERMTGRYNGLAMQPAGYGKVLRGGECVKILPAFLERTDSTAELLLAFMDEAGVDRAVLMSNPFYGFHNDYLAQCVRAYPDRLRGVALVDAAGGQAAADELEGLFQEGSLMGMKFETKSSFQMQPELTLADERVLPIFECCQAYAQPVFIHAFTDQDAKDIVCLAERFADITFVLCHLGADASFRGGQKTKNFEAFLDLAKRRENVFFDISTVPEYVPEPYPFDRAQALIAEACRTVGAGRLLWGTDYPGMLKMATYTQLKEYILNCPKFTQQERENMMGGNAEVLFFGK